MLHREIEALNMEHAYSEVADRVTVSIGGATIVPGLDTSLLIGKDDLKVISKGELFDRSSRTIPVIFEMDNPDDLLKIGQIVQMEIYTSEATSSIAVPEKSIIDEDYAKFVFVQTGGESFERRPVKTGARSQGLVAILDGLSEGEQVVVPETIAETPTTPQQGGRMPFFPGGGLH